MKPFSWSDLKRVVRATVADPVESVSGLRDFLFILLFITVSVRRQISAMATELNTNLTEQHATYFLIREAITNLVNASKLFPQHVQQEILDFIIDLYLLGGQVQVQKGE